jgi:hypothetical protein
MPEYSRPVLTDPFDVVFTGDVARRAAVGFELTERALTEYRVFLHECLQTGAVVVAPNGWLVAPPDDPFAAFLVRCREHDMVELAPPTDGNLDFDELSYGVALEDADGDCAFWLPSFGGALIVPGEIASRRRLVEPLYARLAVVVRMDADGAAVSDEVVTLVIDSFWEVAAEHVELVGLAPQIGVPPLERQIEAWLVAHLDLLTSRVGQLAPEPPRRPLGLGGGSLRVDLALRGERGWLLVQIRRDTAGLATLARLDHALDLARTELATGGEGVEALLVAERADPALVAAVQDRADVQFVAIAALLTGTD